MSMAGNQNDDDLPDFIHIEENDYSKYESSASFSSSGLLTSSPQPPSTTSSHKNRLKEEVFPCDCRWPSGWISNEVSQEQKDSVACGSTANCINRTLFVECRPQDCPSGDHCQNQRFHGKQYKPIQVIKTPGKGHGLKCQEDLKPGDFVIEYVGEVVSQSQMQKRLEINAQLGQKHYYFMTLQSDQILDATRKGNYARFMNHSCNPNCATQKWIVNGQVRIGLFAIRPIPAGTELTFDYKFVRFSSEAQKCLCGEPGCKGFIGTERKESEMFDTDEEDDSEVSSGPSGIDDPEIMAALAKALLRKESSKELKPALETLLCTTSQACLKKFVSLHGLQILQILLGQYRKTPEISHLILRCLINLPIPSRNGLEDSRLEEKVEVILKEDDLPEDLKISIEELLKKWSTLDHAFVIPKTKSTDIQISLNSDRSLTPNSLESASATGGYSLDDGNFKQGSKWGTVTKQGSTERDSARQYQGSRPERRNYERSSQETSRRPYQMEEPRGLKKAKLELPSGWREAKTVEGKVYYYHEKSRETRWDPPHTTKAEEPVMNPSALVEGLNGSDIEAIISRAKAAAVSKAQQQQQQQHQDGINSNGSSSSNGSESKLQSSIRGEISQIVVKYLSRYKDQFKDHSAFKDMARKLTHGLTDKEYRNLLLSGQANFELSKQKRQKIIDYLCQYLRSHGFHGTTPSEH